LQEPAVKAAVGAEAKLVTAEDALDLGGQGHWELVRGEIREMPPAGEEHGFRVMWIAFYLMAHVKEHDLGVVYAAETGFLIARNPDTVRAADVAFISKARVPERREQAWSVTIPDLVVEVVSPLDRAGAVEDKVADWLDAGVPLVWVVWPRFRTIHVYRSPQNIRILTEHDTLDGEDVLPGFSLPVSTVFSGA
jgi:Uma2 family endonuclease